VSDKQWNNRKACFWLLAAACGFQWVMAYIVWGSCVYAITSGAVPLGSCKDVIPNVFELLVGPMAVIMAFMKGSDDGNPPPPTPKE